MIFPAPYGPETPAAPVEVETALVNAPLPAEDTAPPPSPTLTPLPPDTTAPEVQVRISNGMGVITALHASLKIQTNDDRSVTQMRFSADGKTWGAWEPYTPWRAWGFENTPAEQTVYVQVQDAAGNISAPARASVVTELDATRPASAGYILVKSVMGMGGGEKTSSGYTVNGTAGRTCETGLMQSSRYRVISGFWGGVGGSSAGTNNAQSIYLPLVTR